MKSIRTLVAGAVVAGVLAGGAAFAQGPRGDGPGGRGGRGPGGAAGPGLAIRALDLTESQQQQVREIRERHAAAGKAIAERVREAAQAQRAAVQAVPLNEGLIRSTTFALAEAQTDVAVHEATIYNEVWSVLTPAQQAKAKQLQAERAQRGAPRLQRQRQDAK